MIKTIGLKLQLKKKIIDSKRAIRIHDDGYVFMPQVVYRHTKYSHPVMLALKAFANVYDDSNNFHAGTLLQEMCIRFCKSERMAIESQLAEFKALIQEEYKVDEYTLNCSLLKRYGLYEAPLDTTKYKDVTYGQEEDIPNGYMYKYGHKWLKWLHGIDAEIKGWINELPDYIVLTPNKK